MKNLMKIFMVVMSGLFAFSCVTDTTEDLGVDVGGNGQTTFTVSLEGTKTHLGEKTADGKYPLYWCEGDQIAINGVASLPLSANYEGSASATFQVEDENLAAPYCVVYPATEGVGEGTTYPVNFMAEQPYTEGTFASGAAPLYGYVAEAGTIQLNHLTGVLRLAVVGNGEAITSVVFKSETGKISGPFTVNCTNGALTAQEGSSNEVTVTFAEPLVLGAEATPIYAAVPAGSYGGFAITLHTATDKMTVKFNSSVKPILVGSVREFTEFTYQANDVEAGGCFEIDGKEALIEFANMIKTNTFYPNTSAQVVANIDMSGEAWEPIEGFDSYTFDGGSTEGYAIKGLTAPLFGTTSSNISNVKLTDVNIASNGRLILGAVACQLTANDGAQSLIKNCYVSGTITANNPNATIAEDASTYNSWCCGGIVGLVTGGVIDNCVNEANITVNQVANSNNSKAIHPSVAGIAGRLSLSGEVMSSVTNCVNGAEGKTTGAVKYLDNQATSLYTAHVAGIVGLSSETNSGNISGCTNYGAITFNANAAGTGELDYASTSIGGIVGNTFTTFTANNNYGSITVENGNILGLLIGGTAATAKNTTVNNNHNHTNGKIWIKEPVRFYSMTVGGVVGSAAYIEKTSEETVSKLTNDGSITIEASNHSATPLGGSIIYRIAGVIGYCNKSIANCENKANGDITLSGDIILSRNNAQSGVNIAGVYAYSSTVGDHTGNINRGDINVYTNVSKNSAATADQTTFYRWDVGGVAAHTQRAPVGDEVNYGNITIGKADGTAMSVSANGIYIGGVTGQRYNRGVGANATATNHGNITINKGVTLNSNDIGTYIGGCSAFNSTSTTFYNSTNNGNITVNGAITGNADIGGFAGITVGNLNNCNNTGAVHIGTNGSISALTHIGGLTGTCDGTLTSCSNSGNLTFDGKTPVGKNLYFAGAVGSFSGTTVTGCSNSGDVTLNKCALAYTSSTEMNLYMSGLVGYSGAITLTNCSNSGTISTASAINSNFVGRIGGILGGTGSNVTLDNVHNTMKAGVEYGLAISHTTKSGSGSNQLRVGGIIGWQNSNTLTTKNGVSNSAGIKVDGKYLDTGGLSIGGIAGVLGAKAHKLNGTVTNSGNIYYAGQCPSGTFSIGGLFGQSGNTAGKTIEKLVNTGNITLVNTNDKWKPTAAKNGYVGGIAGIDTTDIHNAYCYCTITAIDFEDNHSTSSKNALGMITGSVSAAGLSNCHAGGKIIATQVEDGADASGDGAIIDTPGVLNVSNYAAWLSGDHTFTSAAAKSQSCGYISSITATPQYAN